MFKIRLPIFSNSEESNKKLYGEKYDSSRNYPTHSGILYIPESQLIPFIDYLQKCKPDFDEKTGENVVPLKISGWITKSESGLKYLGMNIEPNYNKEQEIMNGSDEGKSKPPESDNFNF